MESREAVSNLESKSDARTDGTASFVRMFVSSDYYDFGVRRKLFTERAMPCVAYLLDH